MKLVHDLRAWSENKLKRVRYEIFFELVHVRYELFFDLVQKRFRYWVGI